MIEKITGILEAAGIPYAYDHFAEGEAPEPPFICYLLPGSDSFSADGYSYHRISEVRIELYTDEKDPETEEIIAALLDNSRIFYNRKETYIESEKLYEVSFEFTMD